MKYIKTFEMKKPDLDKLFNSLKVGDYILVTSHTLSIENGILQIDKINGNFKCTPIFNIDGWGDVQIIIYIEEIIKKLEPFEVEALKYNL